MGQGQSRQNRQAAAAARPGNAVRNSNVPYDDALVGNTKPAAHGSSSSQDAAAAVSEQKQGPGADSDRTPSTDALQSPPQPPMITVVVQYHPNKKPTEAPQPGKQQAPPAPTPASSGPKPNVEVLLEHEGWKGFPMTPSGDGEFYAIVSAPKGEFVYKFNVDGEVCVDPTQPVRSNGEPANIATVTDALLYTKDDDDHTDDAGWGQEQVQFEETRKFPPILPPHLRYTPLNTPPQQMRCNSDGTISSMISEQHGGVELDPVHLPMPLNVTVNHVYFQRREDHMVMGVTTRYRNKFTTVVYYKGESSTNE